MSSSGIVFIPGCMKGDRWVQKGMSGTETAWCSHEPFPSLRQEHTLQTEEFLEL